MGKHSAPRNPKDQPPPPPQEEEKPEGAHAEPKPDQAR
jgi:hypothetical protein